MNLPIERTPERAPIDVLSALSPTANLVYLRSYHRQGDVDWLGTVQRCTEGLAKLGDLTDEEKLLLFRMHRDLYALPSGRWHWVGGTEWLDKPENYSGSYNCTGTPVDEPAVFGYLMDLAMMGSGTGAVLTRDNLDKLPKVRNTLEIELTDEIGLLPDEERCPETRLIWRKSTDPAIRKLTIEVGDSRNGWVKAYQALIDLVFQDFLNVESAHIEVEVSLAHIRPAGIALKGFGGVSNPAKLPGLFPAVARIMNGALGRKLNSVEASLLIDEAALTVVAGNIRRSAGIRQGDADDELFAKAKDNLWQQDPESGQWKIDPNRDALRMANHTRVYMQVPTYEEILDSVTKQFRSGEGAIQFAPEAIARASADLYPLAVKRGLYGHESEARADFLNAILKDRFSARAWLLMVVPDMPDDEVDDRLKRFALNPCGEIVGTSFHCNLGEVHLNRLDPYNEQQQIDAFKAAGLSVASLLNHTFTIDRYQKARELDPIVGVSFTGLFDFFVHAFGVDWLRWWEAGRPDYWTPTQLDPNTPDPSLQLFYDELYGYLSTYYIDREQYYLKLWKETAHNAVWDYCDRHNLKRPNRCTTVQPAGTKSLLSNASPGWHPPKAQRFIRRITFGVDDPVVRAGMDFGYSVVPGQEDKDEQGNLLNDPFDPRVTTWLLEVPVEVDWASLPGADQIHIEKFSIEAQFSFYMQVQRYYVTHNGSATWEITEAEIPTAAKLIHNAIVNNHGYMSATLLARYDAPFPRLPFEKIDQATYARMVEEMKSRQKSDNFLALYQQYAANRFETGPADSACSSSFCESR